MPEEHQNGTVKAHPWSWHRIFLLFSLTVIMILGFVVVGGGSAMLSECAKTDTRRSIYLSDIVTKFRTKRELLHQLITAWQCDIPAERLPPALVAVSGDLPRSCDSNLLTQLRRGGQGTLAAGVLLVVASCAGYGGAISGRSGPLALYIVVTVVTAVLELAAVGLLVYNKSQLDGVPEQLDRLLAQPLVEPEVVVLPPGGLLTAPGEVPTPSSRPRPGVRRADGTEAATEAAGVLSGRGANVTVATGVTAAGEMEDGTEVLVNSSGTSSGLPVASFSPPSLLSSGSPAAAAEVLEGRRAAADASSRAEGDRVPPAATAASVSSDNATPTSPALAETVTEPIVSKGADVPAATDPPSAVPPAAAVPQPTVPPVETHPRSAVPSVETHPRSAVPPAAAVPQPTAPPVETHPRSAVPPVETHPRSAVPPVAAGPAFAARRRRQVGEWDDHTDEVILHWSPPATDCLLHGTDLNRSHCFSQLEDNLQRELDQTELVLELMLAPLVCAFLACLLQLATICAAWNMISDQQSRRARPPPAPAHQNTSL